jgi:hypothetical protein
MIAFWEDDTNGRQGFTTRVNGKVVSREGAHWKRVPVWLLWRVCESISRAEEHDSNGTPVKEVSLRVEEMVHVFVSRGENTRGTLKSKLRHRLAIMLCCALEDVQSLLGRAVLYDCALSFNQELNDSLHKILDDKN